MRKGVIVPAALLAACGVAATTANDAAGTAPQESGRSSSPDRSGGDPWAGTYRGDFDGGGGEVAIAHLGGGRYDVEVSVGGPGCGGSIRGVGSARGNRLSFSDRLSMGEHGTASCTMHLTRQGDRLSVSGDGDCHYWSGMSCGMSGTVSREDARPQARNGTSGASPAAASSPRPEIVGVWVHQGGYCASGDPIVFDADGGYRNSGGDIEGHWSLSGSSLTVVFAEMDPTTGQTTGSPERVVMRLTTVNANEIRLDQDRMRRCPANGGAEPWHPGQRFTTQ